MRGARATVRRGIFGGVGGAAAVDNVASYRTVERAASSPAPIAVGVSVLVPAAVPFLHR